MKTNSRLISAAIAVLAVISCAACSTASRETDTSMQTSADAVTTVSTDITEENVEDTTAAAISVEYRDIDVHALAAEGANIVHTASYGIYSMEGDSIDSSIKADVYYDLDTEKVVYIDFEEALIPCAMGGAEGWAILDDETAASLGNAVIALDTAIYPVYFELGGILWTGTADNGTVVYTASVGDTEVTFLDYISGLEGGAWYHDNMAQGAAILNADGETKATAVIGTKASINHGVDFWMSDITFPGNIELIKNYIYDNGVSYDYAPEGDDIVQNDAGQWVVADVVTGATLAGTPNYLNLVKQACDMIAEGNYTSVE